MMKRTLLGLVLLTFIHLPAATPAEAQDAAVRVEEDRGWIGISYAVTVRRDSETEEPPSETTVVLTRVYQGSPAAEAGLEAGDTILSVNGVPASAATFRRLDLKPGDRVSLTFRRGAQEEELSLTAAERPQAVTLFRVSPRERVRFDSVRNAIVRFMEDSARVTFLEMGEEGPPGSRIRVLVGADSTPGWAVGLDSLDVMLRGEGPGFNWFRYETGESSFPFSAFVARSERTDSILDEMRALRAELEEARRAELQRQRELAESLAEEQRRIDRSDEELQRTRELQAELRARLARTREILERESRRALLARVAPGDTMRADTVTRVETLRIPAPHVVGRTVVAGAQLLPLNQGLGEYFGTDEGVLVTEVIPGSPAEAAGIEPGDVLVGVAGEAVRSVSEVRGRLSDPRAWPVELTLLRKGERLTVRLSR